MNLARLLQLGDSAFPTGAYAFSDGLETYTQSGCIKNGEQLKALLSIQLELGWGRLDAPACALAWKAWPDAQTIEEINQHLSALKTVEGPRNSSLRTGSTLARTVNALWPEVSLAPGHHAVVFGVAASALKIALPQALSGFVCAWAIGKATAATRLFSIGGTEVQKELAW